MPYSPLKVRVRTFFKTLWSGNFGLAKTYWYYGVVVNIALGFLLFLAGRLFGDLAAGLLALIVLAYSVISSVGIWRASAKYNGPKAFAVLAKIAIVVGWVYNVRSFLVELSA